MPLPERYAARLSSSPDRHPFLIAFFRSSDWEGGTLRRLKVCGSVQLFGFIITVNGSEGFLRFKAIFIVKHGDHI